MNLLAGVGIAPGLTTLGAGLKEGDRLLQTRSIVKVRCSALVNLVCASCARVPAEAGVVNTALFLEFYLFSSLVVCVYIQRVRVNNFFVMYLSCQWTAPWCWKITDIAVDVIECRELARRVALRLVDALHDDDHAGKPCSLEDPSSVSFGK